MTKETALREVIQRAGGFHALARKLQIDHRAVMRWKAVPATRALEVERLTGVSRYRLRPDVYGPEPDRGVSPSPRSDRHQAAGHTSE